MGLLKAKGSCWPTEDIEVKREKKMILSVLKKLKKLQQWWRLKCIEYDLFRVYLKELSPDYRYLAASEEKLRREKRKVTRWAALISLIAGAAVLYQSFASTADVTGVIRALGGLGLTLAAAVGWLIITTNCTLALTHQGVKNPGQRNPHIFWAMVPISGAILYGGVNVIVHLGKMANSGELSGWKTAIYYVCPMGSSFLFFLIASAVLGMWDPSYLGNKHNIERMAKIEVEALKSGSELQQDISGRMLAHREQFLLEQCLADQQEQYDAVKKKALKFQRGLEGQAGEPPMATEPEGTLEKRVLPKRRSL